MASQVEICNIALNHLGTKTIASINENTEQAVRCNLVWNSIRDTVLRDHPWGFARTVETLSLLSDESIPGWDYLYAYPTNCIKIRKIYADPNDYNPLPTEYREFKSPDTNQKSLATNITPAYCEYTYKVTDTTQYDSKFVEAFGYRLAAELAKVLTANFDLSVKMLQIYSATISDAKRLDQEEEHIEDDKESSFESARG